MLSHRLCITVPSSGGRLLEEGDEKIISWNQSKGNYLSMSINTRLMTAIVPIIVVFTKFDLFMTGLDEEKEKTSQELAEQKFKERYGQILEKLTRDISGKIPYTLVASKSVSGLFRLH